MLCTAILSTVPIVAYVWDDDEVLYAKRISPFLTFKPDKSNKPTSSTGFTVTVLLVVE